MTDKVQLIRQEIEKEMSLLDRTNTYDIGRLDELNHLSLFIDSLPEESGCEVNCTTKDEDLEEEIKNYIKDNFFGSGSIGFLSNRTKGELDSVDVANIARHFAEWGRNHFENKSEMVSKDLEEAATKWNETASFQPFYMQLDCNGNPCEVKQDIITHKESFKAGAEWQKQQMKETLQTEYEKGLYDMREEMMKDAVDATIFSELKGSDGSLFQAKTERFRINSVKISDRIKVIPIKPEQQ